MCFLVSYHVQLCPLHPALWQPTLMSSRCSSLFFIILVVFPPLLLFCLCLSSSPHSTSLDSPRLDVWISCACVYVHQLQSLFTGQSVCVSLLRLPSSCLYVTSIHPPLFPHFSFFFCFYSLFFIDAPTEKEKLVSLFSSLLQWFSTVECRLLAPLPLFYSCRCC